jgi:hypothetical protein
MTVQEDQELRERLDALLSGIEPRPAPIAVAMRQGKGIRLRRWGVAAIGFAFVAGSAAVLPTVLHAPRSASGGAVLRYSVTVHSAGKNAPRGLIAYGTQDGHRWWVTISGRGANEQVTGTGTSFGGAPPPSYNAPDVVDVAAAGSTAPGSNEMLVGAVAPAVSSVAVTLSGGQVLTLKPVRYLGQRYFAFVIPGGLPIARAVAYQGSKELAYSVAYGQVELASWWRPGQAVPARFTKTILAGGAAGQRWQIVAQFGPWGYCFALPNGSSCSPQLQMARAQIDQSLSCGGLATGDADAPNLGLAVVRADVRHVRIRLSDGGIEQYTPLATPGGYVLGYVIPKGQVIAHASALSAAGRVLGSLTSLNCPGSTPG